MTIGQIREVCGCGRARRREGLATYREELTRANELIRRSHNEAARTGQMLSTIPAIPLIDIHDALT